MAKTIASIGEKGGVGKSVIISALADYARHLQLDVALYESDRSNPDFLRSWQKYGCQCAIFSESEHFIDSANEVYNSAIAKTTLVNCPAQVHIPLKNWIYTNEILEIAKQDGVSFHFLFVSNGGYDSLKLFQKSVETFPSIEHIFIKNFGVCSDWEAFNANKPVQALIKKFDIKVIDFPKLIGSVEKATIDAEGLTFTEALTYQGFNSISKQRIRKFLREAYAAFAQTDLF